MLMTDSRHNSSYCHSGTPVPITNANEVPER